MSGPGVPQTCRRCGRTVVHAVTERRGRPIILDQQPTEDGTIRLFPAAFGPPVAVTDRTPMRPGERRYRVHVASCRPRWAR